MSEENPLDKERGYDPYKNLGSCEIEDLVAALQSRMSNVNYRTTKQAFKSLMQLLEPGGYRYESWEQIVESVTTMLVQIEERDRDIHDHIAEKNSLRTRIDQLEAECDKLRDDYKQNPVSMQEAEKLKLHTQILLKDFDGNGG